MIKLIVTEEDAIESLRVLLGLTQDMPYDHVVCKSGLFSLNCPLTVAGKRLKLGSQIWTETSYFKVDGTAYDLDLAGQDFVELWDSFFLTCKSANFQLSGLEIVAGLMRKAFTFPLEVLAFGEED
jgi:hypothetical protein